MVGMDFCGYRLLWGLNRFSLKDRKVTESYTEYPECLNVVSDSAGNTLLIKQKDFISCYSPETGSFQDVTCTGNE